MPVPCPIPHPLAWWSGAPDVVVGALEWVVGVDWPDGNEKLVWDLAEEWYAAATALQPAIEQTVHGGQMAGLGFGGSGTELGAAIDRAWLDIAGHPEADLQTLVQVCHEVGELVESSGCDIQAAKIEMYIELGIMAIELLAAAAAAIATLGAASPAAPMIVTISRCSIQQIFRRLLHTLLSKAVKAGAKEAVERVMQKAAEKRLARFALGSVRHAAEEGLEELATDLGTQTYQIDQERRHSIDTTSLLLSAGGGAAGGALGGLAHLGPHAEHGLRRFGENVARGTGGEVLAETGAGLVTGQGVPDAGNLGRSATSGGLSGSLDGTRESLADRRAALLARRADALTDIPSGVDLAQLGGASTIDAAPLTVPGLHGGSVPDADAPVAGTAGGPAATTASAGAPPGQPSTVNLVAGRAAWPVPGLSGPGAGFDSTVDLAGSAPTTEAPSTGYAISTGGPPVGLSSTGPAPVGPAPIEVPASGSAGGVILGGAPVVESPPGGWPPAGPPPVGSPPVGSPPVGLPPVGLPATAPAQAPQPPVSHGGSAALPLGSAALTPPAGGLTGRSALTPTGPTVLGSSDAPIPVTATRPIGPALSPGGQDRVRQADQIRQDQVHRWAEAEGHRRGDLRNRLTDEVLAELEHSVNHARLARNEAIDAGRGDLAEKLNRQLVQPGVRALADLDQEILDTWRDPVGPVTVRRDRHATLNNDQAVTAPAGVDTDDRSALTGTADPPPIEATRAYGRPGGHREPLRFDQEVLEELIPRDSEGRPQRMPDPFAAWFDRMNDSGPGHDPTRGINCVDCVLSLFDTWLHGRPRVSAPRTFDAYADGDVRRPLLGELHGLRRAEYVLGTPFTTTYAQDAAATASPEETYHERMRELERALLNAGPGSFAMLAHEWRDGGGHTWSAVNFEGQVVYLDPQNGARQPAPLYDTRGPHGVVRLAVAVVDGSGRPVGVVPDRDTIHWRSHDPTGGPVGRPPGAAIPGTDFVADGRSRELPDLSQSELDQALIEVRSLLPKHWVRLAQNGRVEILPEHSLDVAMTATVEVNNVSPGQVAAARIDNNGRDVTIAVASRVAPEIVTRAVADGLIGTLSAVVGGRRDLDFDAGLGVQLDVLATERARLVYRLDHEPDAPDIVRTQWEARQHHLAIEFRLTAERAGIVNPPGQPDTEPTSSNRLRAHAGLGDAARAALADLVGNDDQRGSGADPRALLPLTEEFRRSHDALDALTYFVAEHAPTRVRQRFETEVLPMVLTVLSETLNAFKNTYRFFFPSTSWERPLAPKQGMDATERIQPIVDRSQNTLDEVRTWLDGTGLPELRRSRFDDAIELGVQAWQSQYTRFKASADEVIAGFNYLGAPLGYIGSMQNGRRGPHKASARTDLRIFDLDLYVLVPADFDARYDLVKEYDALNRTELLSRGKIFVDDFASSELTPELLDLTIDIRVALLNQFPGNEDIGESTIVLRREPPYRLGGRRWTFS